MSVYAMITGELARPAERRTSKSGNDFVSALLRVENDGATEFWRVLLFDNDMQDELMQMRTGDILSAQGRYQCSTYKDKDGEVRLSPTLFAGAIFPMRQPSKKPKADKPAKSPARDSAPFNDEICF
jgi:hypothetical protein